VTAFIRFEIVRTLRNVKYLAFLVVMPVVFYLLWGRNGGAEAMVAMAVYAACGGALLGSGNTIAEDRYTGWLRSRATHCTIVLSIMDCTAELSIVDDGAGPTTSDGRGNGLIGLTERIQALGGSMSAGAGQDGGFCVRARVPA
jgi:hypothetical protein